MTKPIIRIDAKGGCMMLSSMNRPIQDPLSDFELTIAGKTHSEILAMERWKKYSWYKTLSLEDKRDAMRIVETARRAKVSVSLTGKNNPMYGRTFVHTKEAKAKISAAGMGRIISKETRAKISVALTGRVPNEAHRAKLRGENNPSKRPEVRAKISAAMKGRTLTDEHKAKIAAGNRGKIVSEESRAKIRASYTPERKAMISETYSGANSHHWKGGKSFLPYCRLFNEDKKEEVRNRHGRICVLSDMLRSVLGPDSGLDDFEGHEIFSKRRLSVHHIRGNKMAGCDGTEMALIPLQDRFNTKKFDEFDLEDHPFYITLFLFKDIERKHREKIRIHASRSPQVRERM